jgi:hypothetical protein
VVAVGGGLEAAFGLRLDAMQLHEPLDTILADTNAPGQAASSTPAASRTRLWMQRARLDVDQQSVVADASARTLRIDVRGLAGMVTAGADHPAPAGQGKPAIVGCEVQSRRSIRHLCEVSSSPAELPRQALTDPYVNLSAHTALVIPADSNTPSVQ